jgi:hypothetical protein
MAGAQTGAIITVKDILAFVIFFVYPPSEVQQKLVKNAFQEVGISLPLLFVVHLQPEFTHYT